MRELKSYFGVVKAAKADGSIIFTFEDGRTSAAYPMSAAFMQIPIVGEMVLITIMPGPSANPSTMSGQRLYYTPWPVNIHGLPDFNEFSPMKQRQWPGMIEGDDIEWEDSNNLEKMVETKVSDTLIRSRHGSDIHMTFDDRSQPTIAMTSSTRTDGISNPDSGCVLSFGKYPTRRFKSPSKVKINPPKESEDIFMSGGNVSVMGRESIAMSSIGKVQVGSDESVLISSPVINMKTVRNEIDVDGLIDIMSKISSALNNLSQPIQIQGVDATASPVTGFTVPSPALVQSIANINLEIQRLKV